MVFRDRKEAGLQLAAQLQQYRNQPNTVVVGVARGGVVVAQPIAKALHLPLDVMIIRKVGAPDNEELAIGAIDEEGDGVFNEEIIEILGVGLDYMRSEIDKQKAIAQQRGLLYRQGYPKVCLKEKRVIVVDDGVATGASIRATVQTLRQKGVKEVVLAVPVAAPGALKMVEQEVDQVVCLDVPSVFSAVGQFYQLFDQTSDDEVIKLLKTS